ncbi:MAG: transposase [Deltaproteobacteria bacterium]|nr:transposase [Deltaproteobacteria bacterium]
MARGIERRKIFWDDKDRASFLERLALILEETQTQCYAWALIPNHFHILLRTGATPLSKVMRRLMTGYAVTFNIRHRRAGHLFQNRYKSVICEEDPYLLELIRYIHLNPLRAKIVEDLKALDKYPWSGHSTILGRHKNLLIPEAVANGSTSAGRRIGFSQFHLETEKAIINPKNPVNSVQNKPLAEKTIEDVLKYFGKSLKEARRRYRQFVKNGIDQGKRPEFQGGGLIRSGGGDKAGLLGLKEEEREKGDARILGSGDFVSRTLHESNKAFEKRNLQRPTIKAIIDEVISHFKISPVALFSGSRNGQVSKARAVISYLTVREAGYTQKEVSTGLNVSRIAVRNSLQRAGKYLDTCKQIWANLK